MSAKKQRQLQQQQQQAQHTPPTSNAVKQTLKPTTQPADQTYWRIAFVAVVILAFATRFYRIDFPDEVAFDEVHFGKFAGYYLRRTYFFDVHPPLAKLFLAFAGWAIGYDGHFNFENIGDSYVKNNVPYVGLRAFPAALGALTVPIVFCTMKESGYGLPAALVATSLVLFDNAHIAEDRLILLDAMLVLGMSSALYCYVRFYKFRSRPFSYRWWKWLILTGFSLSIVMSTKYVGLFTYVTIGLAVAIDLWELLDIKRGLTVPQLLRHFFARLAALIIVPFCFYLFWFWIHFSILTRSGPGDEFMSTEFQETLSDNPLLLEARPINYWDTITLVHKDTRAYLHSHDEKYPLRYEDGRVSSQGQQVTGYPYNDTNNNWQILPLDASESLGRRVKNMDVIKLRHVNTNTMLITHDVASPLYATNQEFTTVSLDAAAGDRHLDSQFQIKLEGGGPRTDFTTKAGLVRFQHMPTKVMMWSDKAPLPDWGHRQQEINGNKKPMDGGNIWFAESIVGLNDPARMAVTPRKIKHKSFVTKYIELQNLMFYHNNKLTSSHPYATEPMTWPFLLRGVSFWTKDDSRQQIYLLGNPIGWWLTISLIAILCGVLAADQIMDRRGEVAINPTTRRRLYNSTGFFLLAWAAHYFPFYLMGRQLFLHHYLPAHLASSLVAGAMFQFVFGRVGMKRARTTEERDPDSLLAWTAATAIIAVIVAGFVHFAPVTYGLPGLDVDAANKRKWLDTWDMHYLK